LLKGYHVIESILTLYTIYFLFPSWTISSYQLIDGLHCRDWQFWYTLFKVSSSDFFYTFLPQREPSYCQSSAQMFMIVLHVLKW